MTSPRLEGRVAFVSGSGGGVGREIAVKLAAEGARVVVNDLDAEPAREPVADIVAAGGQAVVCIGNVADDGSPNGSSRQRSTTSMGSTSS